MVYHPASGTTPVGASYDESGVWIDFFSGTSVTKASGSGYLPDKAGQFQLMLNSGFGYLNFVDRSSSTTFSAWTNHGANGVDRLGSGQSVNPGDIYTSDFTIMASVDSYVNLWDGLGRDFIGVRFNNEAGDIFYGYVDVTVNPDYTATLHGFAYENSPGVGIVTGAVPEPASLGLIAVSLLVIIGRRRMRG